MLLVPDLMAAFRRHGRPRGRQGRSAGDDRPLRADGEQCGDPRHPARAQRPAGQGLAQQRQPATTRSTPRCTGRGSRSWIRSRARRIFVPPADHIAGVWARNDDTRGVHKAPANEVVRGAISLELNITKGEHDQLNPVAINCIRSFPGQGIRVWGARTLSSDPEWRYLNVRRLFNFVEESILARHELGRVRAERSEALGLRHPHGHDVPAACVARRCAVRRTPRPRRSSSSATRRTTRPRTVTPASSPSRSVSPP